jgi:hypothetical protein
MEAGFSPENSSVPVVTPATNQILEQLYYGSTLGVLFVTTYKKREKAVILSLLDTVLSNIRISISLSYFSTRANENFSSTTFPVPHDIVHAPESTTNLRVIHNNIWTILKHPSEPAFRSKIYKLLLFIDHLTNHGLHQTAASNAFVRPKLTVKPSLEEQVLLPTLLLDPLFSSLRTNYYYPLSHIMGEETMDLEKAPSNNANRNPTKPSSPTPSLDITADSPIEDITAAIAEFEGDDTPTQGS